MNFSRSVRRQLLTTDLVYGLVGNLLENWNINQRERLCANRINRRVENIKHILYGGEKLILSKKNLRLYAREVSTLLDFVEDELNSGGNMSFFNSVLLVVSDVRMNVLRSNNKKLHREWSLIDQMLNTLYKYRDTELILLNDMSLGKIAGLRIMQLIK